jgi:hypothetical protein
MPLVAGLHGTTSNVVTLGPKFAVRPRDHFCFSLVLTRCVLVSCAGYVCVCRKSSKLIRVCDSTFCPFFAREAKASAPELAACSVSDAALLGLHVASSEPVVPAGPASVSAAAPVTAVAVPQCWSTQVPTVQLHTEWRDTVYSMSMPAPLAVYAAQQDCCGAVRLCQPNR